MRYRGISIHSLSGLLNTLFMSTLLLTSIPRLSAAPITGPFTEGQVYSLEANSTDVNRWLTANTSNGALSLAPNNGTVLPAQWKVHALGNSTYTLENLNPAVGGRWLAIKPNGTIGVNASDSAMTSRWVIKADGAGRYTIANASQLTGNRFIDAKPEIKAIALAGQTDGIYIGTHWKFTARAADATPVKHGTIISLKNLSGVEGKRWLECNTVSKVLALQFTNDPVQFTGSRWRVQDNQDGSFSLECLAGVPGPRFLSVVAGKPALLPTTDRNNATRWLFQRDTNGNSVLRTVDAPGPNFFLNGVTTQGTINMTNSTTPTSTHWQVVVNKAFDPKVEGRWSSVEATPIVAIHSVAQPNGKILFWARFYEGDNGGTLEGVQKGTTNVYLYDPFNGNIQAVPNAPVDPFCSSHDWLPDGRILVTGGHIKDGLGTRSTQIYDYASNTWQYNTAWNMNAGRWYPTTITLANGNLLTMAGTNENGQMNRTPQVFNFATKTWRSLTGLTACGPCGSFYPWLHKLPNGKVFITGPQQSTGYIDVNGVGSFTPIANTNKGYRGDHEGSSVQFAPGKIMILGANPSSASTEIIDLTVAAPQWQNAANMITPRRKPIATILADGNVFVANGNASSRDDDPEAAFQAELFNTTTRTWSALDHSRIPRLYHGTSLLLRDGRVFNSGGGMGGGATPHRNLQIYSPPYLFRGDRPVVSAAPAAVKYGTTFAVTTAQVASIAKVNFIRLGSVTHAFDSSQHFVPLTFVKTATGLTVSAPANANLAPPGPYMLFLVDNDGVPSIAPIMNLN